MTYFVMLACCDAALANPVGPQVINGAVSMARPDARTLNVTNSPGSIIHWQGFSIGAGEITRFTQQSAASAVLNRVVGADISRIQGQLLSNGRVFLINPAGIVLGAGGMIDTAGFVGSTLNMSDADFLAGKLRFDGGGGTVRNEGTIKASGDIYLVGPMVENAGAIRSENGNVVLAAGRSVTITSPNLDGVQFTLQAPSDTALNLGTIEAKNAVAMFAGTLKHSGDTHAGGVSVDAGGNIVLVAQKDLTIDRGSHLTASGTSGGNITVQSGGTTLVSGAIDATGSAGKGGTVHLLGERVGVMATGTVDASGETGGGTILVGGDFQGQNTAIQNAQATYLDSSASLKADALNAGDGGKIILWSDGLTRSHGLISARGGAQGGDGGFVETSGHHLEVTRPPELGAPAGRGGSWLIDPSNIRIVAVGTDSTNGTAPGPFTPNGADSELTVSTINGALNSGTNTITISTVGSAPAVGGSPGDVIFDAALGDIAIFRNFTVGAGNNATLTVNAQNDIIFRHGITTFSTTAAPPPGGPAATFPHALSVVLNPGGAVSTEQTGTTALAGNGLGVTVRVMNGRPWQNAGTIDLSANSTIILQDLATPTLVSTLTNTGHMTIDSTATWSILSGAAQAGVLTNAGQIDINRSTSWENQFNQTASGQLNINNAATSLSMQNGRTIQGAISIAFGSELHISEIHPDAGGGAPVPPTFTDTVFASGGGLGGTLRIQGTGGPNPNLSPRAVFNHVTAPATTLDVDNNGGATITGLATSTSTFGAVTIPSITNSGTLTVNAPLTVVNGVALDAGTLDGSSTLNAASLTWIGGLITGAGLKNFGTITTNPGPVTTLFLDGALGLDRTAGIGGTGAWTVPANVTISQRVDSQLLLSNGAAVTNNGTWRLDGTNLIPIANGPSNAVNVFDNANAFIKNGTGSASVLPVAVAGDVGAFGNTGTITVNAGTLRLPTGRNFDDTGSYIVTQPGAGNTATLEFNGARTFAVGSNIDSAGGAGGITAVNFVSGDIQVNGAFDIASRSTSRISTSGADVSFNGPVTFATGYDLSLGSLTGSGDITMPAGQTFNWSGGRVTGTGAFTTQGTTNISGPVTLSGRTWTAQSDVDMSTSGAQLTMAGGAIVNNSGSWTLTSGTATPIKDGGGGTNTFNNTDNFIKDAAGFQRIDTVFRNTGVVDINTGTLELGAQQLLSPDTGSYNLNGVSTRLSFVRDRTLAAGSDITGTGTARFEGGFVSVQGNYSVGTTGSTLIANGGTALFDLPGPALTIASLNLSNGTLAGTRNLTVGNLVVGTGTIGGSGTFTTNGTASLVGNVALNGRTWTNAGTVTQNASSQVTLTNATIDNTAGPGRAWNVGGSGTVFLDGGAGGTSRFNNDGTLEFLGTGINRQIATTSFTNNGLTIVRGNLTVPQGNGTEAGNYNVVDAGSTLIFAGDRVLGTGSDVSGPGIVHFDSGTVTFGAGYSIANGGQTFIQGGTAVFNTPVTFAGNVLTISGGEMDGLAAITVNGGLNWSGGIISGPTPLSTLTTNGPASSVISGAVLLDTRIWNNSASVNQQGAGHLMLNNAVVNNQAGGVWTLSSTDATPLSGPGSFNNDGTFRNTGVAHSVASTTTFRNRNLLEVRDGSLTLNGGGTHSGTFDISDAATMAFAANQSFSSNSRIEGPGTARFTAGNSVFQSNAGFDGLGTFAMSGSAGVTFQTGAVYNAVDTTSISGGTLTLGVVAPTNMLHLTGGSVLNGAVTVNSGGTWSDGALANTVLVIAPGATFNLTGAALKTANNTTIVNEGTTNLAGTGDLRLGGGSVFDNLGTFNVQTNAGVATQGAPGSTFSNGGLLHKSGGSGTSVIAPAFENTDTGTVHVSSGTLRVTGSFASNDGTINTEPLTTFSTNGMPLTNAGTIMGKGTIDLGTAMLTNNGLVAPGASPGALVINGDYTQGPNGVLAIELGGPVQGVTYDLLQVTGAANLGGTLHVVTSGGFVPASTDTFNFMTYASHSGDFASKIYPDPSYQATPGAAAYVLTAQAQGTSTAPGGTMRDLATTENERLRENLENVVSTRDAETDRKPQGGRSVCN